MQKKFYDVISQIERILNKAQGNRYNRLKTHFEDKFYPHKAVERFGYESGRPIIKFTTIS